MSHRTRVFAAFAPTALMLLAACSGGDDTASATDDTVAPVPTEAPTTEVPTTEAPTTEAPTTETPTTEAPAPTTEAPKEDKPTVTLATPDSNNVGVVWASVVNPDRVNAVGQPVFTGNGITARLESVLYIDAEGSLATSQQCRDAIDWDVDVNGGESYDHCLYVQWSFDVSPDLTSDGMFYHGELTTPSGLELDAYAHETGRPGSTNRLANAMIPGGEPGSVLTFVMSNDDVEYDDLTGYGEQQVQLPTVDQMMPIDF